MKKQNTYYNYKLKEERAYDEYADFIMNEVSDEKITDLFAEMGIEINLGKDLDYSE